jgi:hypothetical protein
MHLPIHIVGGRGDDRVRGDAFGISAKAKKKPETGDFARQSTSAAF